MKQDLWYVTPSTDNKSKQYTVLSQTVHLSVVPVNDDIISSSKNKNSNFLIFNYFEMELQLNENCVPSFCVKDTTKKFLLID